MISNKLISNIVDMIENDITAIAVGTGQEPNLNDYTNLDQEVLRKSGTVYVDDDTIITELYIDETECNDINLTNTGIFGSGILLAGGKIDETKGNTESLTVSIEVTIERG